MNGRYNKRHIIKIVIFVCEIIATGVIPAVLSGMGEMTISIGVGILAADISVLFLITQFMSEQTATEILENQEKHFMRLTNVTNAIETNIGIAELYKQIYLLENAEQKEIYLDSIQTFVNAMESRMAGMRSGALPRHAYYGELSKAGDAIITDKNKSKASVFKGEIWAMTFWQDDELDLSDEYENAWVKKMESMDAMGIKTTRLCVMKNKKSLLNRNCLDESVLSLLERLSYYCKNNAVCKNTTVYAIDSIDTLPLLEQEWIGKGFFAIRLSDGSMRLIRGVSLDNRNATTLGGEIDFDSDRVEKIREIWEKLIEESGRRDINQYLFSVSSDEVKKQMEEMGFSKST